MQKSNWPIVTALLLMGALPALPGAYMLVVIMQGTPPDGTAHGFVRAHYFDNRLPIVTHALAGITFAVLMPFQFAHRLRARRPQSHRASGRLVFLAGNVLALSGLWMLIVYPTAGGVLRTAGLIATGLATLACLWLAVIAIVKHRDMHGHRVWMTRAVAVAYGAVVPALVFIPWFLLIGEPPAIMDELTRWFGMALNLSVVDWASRRNRRGKRPIIRRVVTP